MPAWNDQLPAVSKLSLRCSNHVEYGAGLRWSTSYQLFSKPSLSWLNHVEYGAGLSWSTSYQLFQNLAWAFFFSTSYQLFQNLAWAGQTMLSTELIWAGQPTNSCFKTKLEFYFQQEYHLGRGAFLPKRLRITSAFMLKHWKADTGLIPVELNHRRKSILGVKILNLKRFSFESINGSNVAGLQ